MTGRGTGDGASFRTVEAWVPDTSRFAPLAREVGNDGGGVVAPVAGEGDGGILEAAAH
jgi:hypothetical protein